MPNVLHFFRHPITLETHVLRKIKSIFPKIISVDAEYCFNVEVDSDDDLPIQQKEKLLWIFGETFEPEKTGHSSYLSCENDYCFLIEVGPRLAFTTAWSSNCVSICNACGITSISRIERSRRYLVTFSGEPFTFSEVFSFAELVHDRMTECVYTEPLQSFSSGVKPEPVQIIPVMSEGRAALERLNRDQGLGFDDWDLDFYTNMFQQKLQRDPTNVECFDLAQSNSEHSRHWFFSGKIEIDGIVKDRTLFQMVKGTLPADSNSIIAFHDNSSAIHGFEVNALSPADPTKPSPMTPAHLTLHPILTAETHNFPSGVAPFPGAETGTGGRLRDVQATGRGAHSLAGISAYCVGNLNIPEHPQPWETETGAANWEYPSNLASPLDIEVEASNGASDYGNKYGEPVVGGFTRSFGMRLPNGERVEWIKPVMFTAGAGLLNSLHADKGTPEKGMVVCKIGGPAYRIGMGGGAASSRVGNTGEADIALDFNAVQRGDAEMGNRLNRVVRGCVEMGFGVSNPIVSIHDQGAGGNGNVLKEIVEPLGAHYQLRKIPLGDPSMSAMEIWGAEYQENDAILVRAEDLQRVISLGERENCPVSPVGEVTGDGKVVLEDGADGSRPVDLPLELVLGKMPQKTFRDNSPTKVLLPLAIPESLSHGDLLRRVLRLLDVGSKRFLTNKVDRCVSGLIAQQQCVGPLHTPLADVSVLAQTHFSLTGMAVAVGEQPIKGLLSPGAQARMTVGEALCNLVWARITSLADVKASGNWMWAAKLPGEAAKMWEACEALCDLLVALGPSIDGGKDSLSMAAKVGKETVKCPGQLTLTCYAGVPDITLTVTPDIKAPGQSKLLLIDLGRGLNRLGGTALSTVLGQLGDEAPDLPLTDAPLLKTTFESIQSLLDRRLILAGHDRSDGGLLVCALEMAFAGNCGVHLDLPVTSASSKTGDVGVLFGEELGLVLEVQNNNVKEVLSTLETAGVPITVIGATVALLGEGEGRGTNSVSVKVGGRLLLEENMLDLRDVWESTSFALEALQCELSCTTAEKEGLRHRTGPPYKLLFDIAPPIFSAPTARSRVAVIRQEGSNGDREMLAALHAAGLEAWDVHMRDLTSGSITLDGFRGIVFCGGFSYADVNDSAKGWAAVIRYSESLSNQFAAFRKRQDTFSLGVCNGCQLMALMGWVPFDESEVEETHQPRLVHNSSRRFESRWCAVKVLPSPAVLLRGMAGSVLGVWVAHGEGKVHFPGGVSQMEKVVSQDLAPIRYVDDAGGATETYPCNPNGSPNGIAALCSKDGRHLAMMPHPERCFLTWQCPHIPEDWRRDLPAAPWLRLFQNARKFVEGL